MSHLFSPILAKIKLKFGKVWGTTNLSHLNCYFYGVLKRVILRRRLGGKGVVLEKTKQAACVPTIGMMHHVSEFTFQST